MTPERKAEIDAMLAKSGIRTTPTSATPGIKSASGVGMTPERKAEIDAMLQSKGFSTAPAAPVAAPEKGPGFIAGMAKNFAKAGANISAFTEGVGELGAAGIETVLGDKQRAQKHINKAAEAQTRQRDFGVLGKVRPFGTNQGTGEHLSAYEGAKDIIGGGLDIGSYFVPAGTSGKAAFQAMKTGSLAAAKPILGKAVWQGLGRGSLMGGLSSGGRSIQEAKSLKEGLIRTAAGTAAGGVVGAAIPALSFGTRATAAGIKKAVSPQLGQAATHAASQGSGLSTTSVKNIIKDTSIADDALRGNQVEGREALGNKVSEKFKGIVDDLQDSGAGYNEFRVDPTKLPFKKGASGYPDFVDDVMKKYGLSVNSKGIIQPPTSATTLDAGDVAALQKVFNQYGKGSTANDLLNMRSRLSELAQYGSDPTKPAASKSIAKALRGSYDDFVKANVKGLAAKDAEYAPQREFVNQMQKMLFDNHGQLKDNAISTLTSSTNVNNAGKLAKLEKLMPGITREVNVLKVIDELAASSLKPGTYVRGAFGAAGLATMNPVMILASLFGTPQNFIRGIQAYGNAQGQSVIANSAVRKIIEGQTLNLVEKGVVKAVINAAAKAASDSKQE